MTDYAYDPAKLGPYRVDPVAHYGLAVTIAKSLPRPQNLTREDMVQEALAMLCAAARTYDPKHGVPFAGWAGRLIRNHLAGVFILYWRVGLLGSRNQRSPPKAVREHFSGLNPSYSPSVIGPLLRANHRWHGATDYDCGVVAQVTSHSDTSLDETLDHGGGDDAPGAKVPLVETIPDEHSTDPYTDWEEATDADLVVRKALGWMTVRERELCQRRVLDVDTDNTLEDFAAAWGVTRQRVQQIEVGVREKLKRAFRLVSGA